MGISAGAQTREAHYQIGQTIKAMQHILPADGKVLVVPRGDASSCSSVSPCVCQVSKKKTPKPSVLTPHKGPLMMTMQHPPPCPCASLMLAGHLGQSCQHLCCGWLPAGKNVKGPTSSVHIELFCTSRVTNTQQREKTKKHASRGVRHEIELTIIIHAL